MERTGAPALLRDEGALAGALARPQMVARYEAADIVTQAVVLMMGVALAHAFVDGNKRTAFMTGRAFLLRNGYRYIGDRIELAKQIEAVLTREESLQDAEARFVAWLRPQLRQRAAG